MLDLVDFILNVAGLLLWLSWRSLRLDPFHRGVPATLSGTVRRAEPTRIKRWHFLLALGVLLVVRAFFYGQIGAAVNWAPKLDLTVVTPAFPLTKRVLFLSVLLYSVLSFVRILVIFYFWLLAVAMINRRVTNPDSLQKLLLVQLGRVARWPLFLQLLLPIIASVALWALCHPLLLHVSATTPVKSNVLLLEQGLVLGFCLYVSLKILVGAFLAAYIVATYVYLGNNPVWDFITVTSRNILSPLKRLPLRAGRMDFTPLLVIVLIILVFYYPLPAHLQYILEKNRLAFWPE